MAIDVVRDPGDDVRVPRDSWLSRWFSRASGARLDGRHARRIIKAYASCLDRRSASELHRSERELPYSKEEIGRAILLALKFASGPETMEPLRSGFVELERFLVDDEWPIVQEYEHRITGPPGASLDAMAPERREAAVRILADVDVRRARRLALLEILEQERRGG